MGRRDGWVGWWVGDDDDEGLLHVCHVVHVMLIIV